MMHHSPTSNLFMVMSRRRERIKDKEAGRAAGEGGNSSSRVLRWWRQSQEDVVDFAACSSPVTKQ